MPITYGKNLAKSSGALKWSGTVLMKAYTTHTEASDVFLSYRHTDEATAWDLAQCLDLRDIRVFIDVHDNTLAPGHGDLDDALMTAIGQLEHDDNRCLRQNPGFMVGAVGGWCLHTIRQTESPVQAAGLPYIARLP